MISENFISFPSPAKINLFLHVVGQRADGYHELETAFQFLDHSDTIELSINNSKNIDILTPIKGVKNSDNLIYKAATLLQSHAKNEYGVKIKLNKILPMGGGLGGGSSNAATILLALNKLWDINLPIKKLEELGLVLGADVPIFINGYAAFAQGIGEVLTPITPPQYWYLVSKPDCSIATQAIFKDPKLVRNTPKLGDQRVIQQNVQLNDQLDFQTNKQQEFSAQPAFETSVNILPTKITNHNIISSDFSMCHNDCEPVVIKNYPKVANLLAWLVEYAPSRMTGTGACVFSQFHSESEAKKVQSMLPIGIESFVAKGINQSPLINAIKKHLIKIK